MKRIRLTLAKSSYDIIIGQGIINRLAPLVKKLSLGQDSVIITNPLIRRKLGRSIESALLKGGLSVKFFEVSDTEKSKSIATLTRLINRIAKYDVKKKTFIIAFGGGVIGDLAGFVAAIYKRGVPYIQIPTTLLAQIDSSIGGKTGIDLTLGKNLIGAFNQPRLVLSDVQYLKYLPAPQLRSGLAEAIKYGVIKDPTLFRFLEKNHKYIVGKNLRMLEILVSACSKIKAGIVERDEREEKGLRTILNFGHTVGHALEAASGYRGLSHGEAVALGMIAASRISHRLGMLNSINLKRIESLIRKAGLPAKIRDVKFKEVMSAFQHDKKFISGKNRLVLPLSIGKVTIVEDVPLAVIDETVAGLIG